MLLVQPKLDRLPEYLELCKLHKLGFELMELAYPAILDDEPTVQRIVDAYSDAPLYSLHGVFIDLNFSGGDPLVFEASKKRIIQCIETAARLELKRIVLHNCFFPTLTASDVLYDYWSNEAAEFLIPLVEKYNFEIFLENVLDVSPFVLNKLMSVIKHPKIGVCLDIGHANLSKTPFEDWIDMLHPHVKYIHLSDNNGIYDEHLALGDGNIDYAEAFRLLDKYKVSVPSTLEVGGIEGVQKSLEFLKGYAF